MKANELLVEDISIDRERRKALNELKEQLAQRAVNFLEGSKSKPSEMGDKQIRNLVALAQMAATPLEIEAFIDYQMGRDNKEVSWSKRIEGEPFGERLKRELKEIVDMARQKRPEDKRFSLLCLAQFFGYLAWRVKYLEYLRAQSGEGRR
ncbi:hypothetical protein [Thermanaeromonas sp. C210]|uniref:hypothetical protein n=1 Tax=Thermanaeromonas sp. C210 TaxID=2731925 RepID=UPI00155C46FD|nr:hypothetical protein [Thermanaeromonas sp. C210]GFN23377.1 hypothetical protein TAMC210_16940 [Thermanaeromonas sp. C210]